MGEVETIKRPEPVTVKDEVKIAIVRGVLDRLEAGEQFTGLAVLLVDGKRYEYPHDGYFFEILTAATRLVHRMNLKMDE